MSNMTRADDEVVRAAAVAAGCTAVKLLHWTGKEYWFLLAAGSKHLFAGREHDHWVHACRWNGGTNDILRTIAGWGANNGTRKGDPVYLLSDADVTGAASAVLSAAGVHVDPDHLPVVEEALLAFLTTNTGERQ